MFNAWADKHRQTGKRLELDTTTGWALCYTGIKIELLMFRPDNYIIQRW